MKCGLRIEIKVINEKVVTQPASYIWEGGLRFVAFFCLCLYLRAYGNSKHIKSTQHKFLELHSPPEGTPSLKLVSVHDRRGGWGDSLPVSPQSVGEKWDFRGRRQGNLHTWSPECVAVGVNRLFRLCGSDLCTWYFTGKKVWRSRFLQEEEIVLLCIELIIHNPKNTSIQSQLKIESIK